MRGNATTLCVIRDAYQCVRELRQLTGGDRRFEQLLCRLEMVVGRGYKLARQADNQFRELIMLRNHVNYREMTKLLGKRLEHGE